MSFTNSMINPLTNFILFEKPYLRICKNNQKKKKPEFSKLSVLTKSSIESTKVPSNEFKRGASMKNSKRMDKKINSQHMEKPKKKIRSNSCKPPMDKTIKIQGLDFSYQPEDFQPIQKQTSLSRTLYQKHLQNSISPLYSSLIFNEIQEQSSPKSAQQDFTKIFDKTSHMLSEYKQKCTQLKKQRDHYKKTCVRLSSKIKKMSRNGLKQKF